MDENKEIVEEVVLEDQPEIVSEPEYVNYPGPMNNGFSTANANSAPRPNNLARGMGRFHNPMQKPKNDEKSKSPKENKSDSLDDKKGLADKSSSSGNLADNSRNGNPLPGAVKGKNEKPNASNNQAQKKPNPKQNDNNKNKMGKKMPAPKSGFGKAAAALSGLRSKSKEKKESVEGETEEKQEGIGNLISIIPIGNPVVKVVLLVAGPALPIILLILAITIIAGIIPTFAGKDMCADDNNSSSNYYGSADVTEFTCKMQSPLGKLSYPLCGYVGEPRPGHTHDGMDLSLGRGTPVYAVQSGKVEEAHNSTSTALGRYVSIRHGESDLVTRYAHLSSIQVSKGDTVGKGQKIGEIGGSGNGSESSYANHLHFSLYKNGEPQQIINDYFGFTGQVGDTGNCFSNNTKVSDSFKNNCGSQWDGEPTGDSANQSNETDSYTPSTASSSNNNSKCCVNTGSTSTTGTGGYCSNGITVEGSGTLDINDYIAGVVTAENSYEENGNIEASKANAVAARTYAINRTNNCKEKIGNSQAAQVYKTPGDIGKKASSETASQVMLYNGDVFSSEYDSFCGSSGTATYTKVPSSETHVLKLNSKFSGKIAGGHCRGMSQLYARQLQDEGKKYDEILRFFYADGIEITGVSSSNSCYVTQNSYSGDIVRFYQTDYDEPYSTFGTIKTHGCGPTAMAVVVSSLTGSIHDPVELTNYACSNGYCYDSGTANGFFPAAGKKYGLNVKEISVSKKDEVLIALNRGDSLVVALMGKGTFTDGGHFIVLTGSNGDDVSIHDPVSKERSGKTFNFEKQIVAEASKFWIISK